jgi:hypothetical protein
VAALRGAVFNHYSQFWQPPQLWQDGRLNQDTLICRRDRAYLILEPTHGIFAPAILNPDMGSIGENLNINGHFSPI